MKTVRKLAHVVASLALALTGVVALGGTAHAGSGGQQIMLVDNAYLASSIRVNGLDQNGNNVTQCFNTPGVKTQIANWWWQGSVTIVSYTDPGCTGWQNWSGWADVPKVSSGNWWAITTSNQAPRSTQQIEFIDNRHIVYSMYISGTNQNGSSSGHCVATPGWENYDNNWWWDGAVTVTTYASGNCTGSSNGYFERYVNGASNYTSWFAIAN